MQHTDPVVVIHLPISKVNIVLVGLAELPIKVAASTYETIKKQAEEEVQRQNDFLSQGVEDHAEVVPQANVKRPPEPTKADSAPS